MSRFESGQFHIPETVRNLGNLQELLLDERKSAKNQLQQIQRMLQAIWDVTEKTLYPLPGITGNRILYVPTKRLEELGLVSIVQDGKKRTAQGRVRRTADTINGHKDSIMIDRPYANGPFTFLDSYINEEVEATKPNEGQSRRHDSSVEEKLVLTKEEDGNFTVTIEGHKAPERVFIDGKWRNLVPLPTEFKERKVTARRLNTTFALLVEGIASGILGKPKEK